MSSVQKNITVALLAFIDDDGKILLNRRREEATKMWELIGGGVEEGELPEEAIRREILEEIGYTISPEDNLCCVDEFMFENERYVANVSFFTASYPGIHLFSDSDETFVEDLKLFTQDEALAQPLLPIAYDILKNFLPVAASV